MSPLLIICRKMYIISGFFPLLPRILRLLVSAAMIIGVVPAALVLRIPSGLGIFALLCLRVRLLRVLRGLVGLRLVA